MAFFLAFVVVLLAASLPGLIKDIQLQGQLEAPSPGSARLGRTRCRALVGCDFTIEHRAGGERLTTRQSLFFFMLPFRDHPVAILQRRGNPAIVTTSLAQDALWNRIVTLALSVALFAGCALFCLRSFLQDRAERRYHHLDGARLRPVPVKLFGFKPLGWLGVGGSIWYSGPLESAVPVSEVRLPWGAKPFALDADRTVALAVTSGHGQTLLLDKRLTLLRLTKAERRRIRAWADGRGAVAGDGAFRPRPSGHMLEKKPS